jgi:PilZ domain
VLGLGGSGAAVRAIATPRVFTVMSALFPPEYQPFVLPASVGVGVGLVMLLLLLASKKRGRQPAPQTSGGIRSSHWTSPVPTMADRRGSARREGGSPVKVTLASPVFKGGSHVGYVLDRSTGGLRLASSTGLPVGSSVQVRACHAPDETPWVTILVRSCQPSGKGYEMGCEFDKTPPWSILLLFG